MQVVSPEIPLAPTASNPTLKLLVKPSDAAEALSISPRKLWAMTNSGEIPCLRLGRAVRYDPQGDCTISYCPKRTCSR
jgi:hypothetical protein